MNNNLLILTFVIAAAIVVIALILKKDCKTIIDCPKTPYTNTPIGLCLKDCDLASDQCYRQCKGNDNCIQACYQVKSQCYIQCLGPPQESFENDCGC